MSCKYTLEVHVIQLDGVCRYLNVSSLERHTYAKTLKKQIGEVFQFYSASPKSAPLNPILQHATSEDRSCVAIFGMLHCRHCTATSTLSAMWMSFCQSCAATDEQLHGNIAKARCKKMALSCRFPEDFRLPRFWAPSFRSC